LVGEEGQAIRQEELTKELSITGVILEDNQLSVSFIAGIKLLDVFRNHYWNQ
jgi:hypothetical protein